MKIIVSDKEVLHSVPSNTDVLAGDDCTITLGDNCSLIAGEFCTVIAGEGCRIISGEGSQLRMGADFVVTLTEGIVVQGENPHEICWLPKPKVEFITFSQEGTLNIRGTSQEFKKGSKGILLNKELWQIVEESTDFAVALAVRDYRLRII